MRFSAFRLVAASLAAFSLLTVPVRGLMACPMLPASAEASQDHEQHHAHHGADQLEHLAAQQGGLSESPEAPAQSGEPCPDLAHCVVAAVPVASVSPDASGRVLVARVPAQLSAPASIARALEPPPPRA